MPFPIPFLGPMGPLGTPIVPMSGTPILPVSGTVPPPFGSIAPGSPMPLIRDPLNPAGNTRLMGGPFGGNVSYGAGLHTSGGNFVVISNFGHNSVSNFGRLKKSGDTFNDLIKELGSPNCVINKKNGVAVWVDETYRHTLNDTDDAIGVSDPTAGGTTRTKGIVTTTVTLKPGATPVLPAVLRSNGVFSNNRIVHVTSDTAAHNLAVLVIAFTTTPAATAWANSFEDNKKLLDAVSAANFE